ncbi:MAG: hypothetical protein IPO90_07585 [Flavobacteriales bacterium]|nr:hypothetical protein [Flavobacteriales bacterium]
MNYLRHFFLFVILGLLLGCTKDEETTPDNPVASGPRLILKFKFDSTQVRLNGLGQPEPAVEAGHGAQSPVFDRMSAHYAEFAPNATTLLGQGDIVYHAPETTLGGAAAIDHDLSLEVAQNGEFLNIPLSDLSPGTYEWLRVSLAYQNYNIKFRINPNLNLTGTIASFIGYDTYISSFAINDSIFQVNGNRRQGFWGFETLLYADTGSASPGATTVPNPLFTTSPVPAGSCVVTGELSAPLTVTGLETEDVVIIVSLSTNKSFEWAEIDGDNVFEPLEGEFPVDMGIRGMIPIVQ